MCQRAIQNAILRAFNGLLQETINQNQNRNVDAGVNTLKALYLPHPPRPMIQAMGGDVIVRKQINRSKTRLV